jgi:uncharacterized protein (DUF924 family)
MNADAQRVLDFWYGAAGSPQHGTRRAEWFKKSAAFDAEVRKGFLAVYDDLAAAHADAWAAEPHELLAKIIVLDQFPRNMFRDTPRAFATDGLALASAEMLLRKGWDTVLAPIERWFAYLPFEHAEDLALQRRAVELFGALAADPAYADLLDWAQKHYVIIERFGRFPHRNAILGRPSTPEEAAFLKQPGSSF